MGHPFLMAMQRGGRVNGSCSGGQVFDVFDEIRPTRVECSCEAGSCLVEWTSIDRMWFLGITGLHFWY